MKIRNLLAALSVLLLSACGGNKYTVVGNIEGLSDGETVSLCNIDNGVSLVPFDSVMVKDGKFQFTGETDTCDLCILSFNMNGEMATCTFFLEPGRIKISYKDQMQTIGGTRVNDSFQKFYDEVSEVNEKAMDLENRIQQAGTDGMDSLRDEMVSLQDMYRNVVVKSIRENCDNEFGVQQMLDSYSMLDVDELDELLSEIEANFPGNGYVVQLREMTDAQLRTADGKPFIDFSAMRLGEEEMDSVNFSEYVSANKVVLLDFWASWCQPCRGQIPYMKEAYEKFHGDGFEIVSVSVDEDLDSWKAALKDEGMSWPQLVDLQMDENSPALKYAVNVIPTSFLIDSDGIIIARNLRDEEYIEVLTDYFGR